MPSYIYIYIHVYSSCSELVFNETQVFNEMQPLLSLGLCCLTEDWKGGLGLGSQALPDQSQQPTLKEPPARDRVFAAIRLWHPAALCQDLQGRWEHSV